jgi:hypothetical protein
VTISSPREFQGTLGTTMELDNCLCSKKPRQKREDPKNIVLNRCVRTAQTGVGTRGTLGHTARPCGRYIDTTTCLPPAFVSWTILQSPGGRRLEFCLIAVKAVPCGST